MASLCDELVGEMGRDSSGRKKSKLFYVWFACLPSTAGLGWVTGCDELVEMVGVATSHDNETYNYMKTMTYFTNT